MFNFSANYYSNVFSPIMLYNRRKYLQKSVFCFYSTFKNAKMNTISTKLNHNFPSVLFSCFFVFPSFFCFFIPNRFFHSAKNYKKKSSDELFERDLEEDIKDVNDKKARSTSSYISPSYVSVIKNETNSSLKKHRYGARPAYLFKTEDDYYKENEECANEDVSLSSLTNAKSKHNRNSNNSKKRFSVSNLATNEDFHQKTFWEELQEESYRAKNKRKAYLAQQNYKMKNEQAKLKSRKYAIPSLEENVENNSSKDFLERGEESQDSRSNVYSEKILKGIFEKDGHGFSCLNQFEDISLDGSIQCLEKETIRGCENNENSDACKNFNDEKSKDEGENLEEEGRTRQSAFDKIGDFGEDEYVKMKYVQRNNSLIEEVNINANKSEEANEIKNFEEEDDDIEERLSVADKNSENDIFDYAVSNRSKKSRNTSSEGFAPAHSSFSSNNYQDCIVSDNCTGGDPTNVLTQNQVHVIRQNENNYRDDKSRKLKRGKYSLLVNDLDDNANSFRADKNNEHYNKDIRSPNGAEESEARNRDAKGLSEFLLEKDKTINNRRELLKEINNFEGSCEKQLSNDKNNISNDNVNGGRRSEEICATRNRGNLKKTESAYSYAEIIRKASHLRPESWLNMPPEKLILQREILKSKNYLSIFNIVSSDVNNMDAIHIVTCIHRLGRYSKNSHEKESITRDERFKLLVDYSYGALHYLCSQGLCNLLWGFIKLDYAPSWINTLLKFCRNSVKNFDVHHISTCLFCLSKLAFPSTNSVELRDALISRLSDKMGELKTTLDITCVSTALAKLQVRHKNLFHALAAKVKDSIGDFEMQEIAGICWSFASLSFTDAQLFSKVKSLLETNVEKCSLKDVVQFAWSFSRLEEADEDFFKYTLSPAIRMFLLDMGSRELCTIAWSFCNANISDPDLFADMSVCMLPKVKDFTPHDVSTVVVAFSQISYSNKDLFKALKTHTYKIYRAFSPLQLSKVIYGFGISGVSDDKLFDMLCNQVMEKQFVLYPENVVQILVGLYEAEYLSHEVVHILIKIVSKKVDKLFAEDCVQILHILAKVAAEKNSVLIEQLFSQIRQRVQTWWCFNCSNAADLLEAMKDLKVYDKSLINLLMRQMHVLLKNASLEESLRFIGGLSCMTNHEFTYLVKTHIQRRPRIQMTLSNKLNEICSLSTDLQSAIVLSYTFTKLGYEDESFRKLNDDIQHKIETEGELPTGVYFSFILWSFTELNIKSDFVRNVLKYFLRKKYDKEFDKSKIGEYRGGEILLTNPQDPFSPGLATSANNDSIRTDEGEAFLRLAWIAVVLCEEDFLMHILCDAHTCLEGAMPREMLLAQQVAFHVCKNKKMFFEEMLQNAQDDETEKHKIKSVRVWMNEINDYLRNDLYIDTNLYYKNKANRNLKVVDFNFDKWISEILIQMRIPHKTTHALSNIYRVCVAFPLEKHLIDVLSFQDLLSPTSRAIASAELRQRQLSQLGWTVHSVSLRDIYNAVKDKTLKTFVAKIVSTFDFEAAKFSNFLKEDEKCIEKSENEQDELLHKSMQEEIEELDDCEDDRREINKKRNYSNERTKFKISQV